MRRKVKKNLMWNMESTTGVRTTLLFLAFLAKRIIFDGLVFIVYGIYKLGGWAFKKITGDKFSKDTVKEYFEDAMEDFEEKNE